MITLQIKISESGVIKHYDYAHNEDITWPIETDCENVKIKSEFDMEKGYDFMKVDGQQYTGQGVLEIIAKPNFSVHFTSDRVPVL